MNERDLIRCWVLKEVPSGENDVNYYFNDLLLREFNERSGSNILLNNQENSKVKGIISHYLMNVF